jgi:hypothetical protein
MGRHHCRIVKTEIPDRMQSIVWIGQRLSDARQYLGTRKYRCMLQTAGIREWTARRYVAIAMHPALSNPDYASQLPTSIRTLSELARHPAQDVERLFTGGKIHPDSKHKDVARLFPPASPFDWRTYPTGYPRPSDALGRLARHRGAKFGYRVHRSRKPRGAGNAGRYVLVDKDSSVVLGAGYSASIEEILEFLAREARMKKPTSQ